MTARLLTLSRWPAGLPLSTMIAASILTLIAVISLAAPFIAPFGEAEVVSYESFAYPAQAGPLGTDYLGRDLLSRLLYGGRYTLAVALLTTVASFVPGTLLGFAAGLKRGLVDDVASRLVDGLLAFPAIVLALLMISALGTSAGVLVGTVALIEACRIFRIARALARDISVLDYVTAARLRGEGFLWLSFREVLPNAAVPLAAEFGLRFTYVILLVSALSFIGLGVQPPTADWGVMVRENAKGLLGGSWAALLPAACLAMVTISVNLIIDAAVGREQRLRDPEALL
jgi:peptide/nickel transport system permease protein